MSSIATGACFSVPVSPQRPEQRPQAPAAARGDWEPHPEALDHRRLRGQRLDDTRADRQRTVTVTVSGLDLLPAASIATAVNR